MAVSYHGPYRRRMSILIYRSDLVVSFKNAPTWQLFSKYVVRVRPVSRKETGFLPGKNPADEFSEPGPGSLGQPKRGGRELLQVTSSPISGRQKFLAWNVSSIISFALKIPEKKIRYVFLTRNMRFDLPNELFFASLYCENRLYSSVFCWVFCKYAL